MESQFSLSLDHLLSAYQTVPEKDKQEKFKDISHFIETHFADHEFSETEQLNLKNRLIEAKISEQNVTELFNKILVSNNPQKESLETMPLEIQRIILSYLGKDIKNFLLVNQSLRSLISQDKILQAIMLEKVISNLDLTHIQQIIEFAQKSKCGGSVKYLNLSFQMTLTDAQFISFIQVFPNLRQLNLSMCEKITAQGLKSIENLSELQSLNLVRCLNITDEGLQSIGKLINLQTLNLSMCNKITAQGLKFLEQLSKLEDLYLNNCRITPNEIRTIIKLANLKELYLTGTPINNEGLELLTQASNLELLALNNCPDITGETLKSIIKKMPKLQQINLGGNPQISKDDRNSIEQLIQSRKSMSSQTTG